MALSQSVALAVAVAPKASRELNEAETETKLMNEAQRTKWTQRNTTQRNATAVVPVLPPSFGATPPKAILNSTLHWPSTVTAEGLQAMTNRTTFTPTWWILCHEYKDNVNFRTPTLNWIHVYTPTLTHAHKSILLPRFPALMALYLTSVVFHASA